ncbi:hypothetical protein LZ32DRAFT_147715 [Colletotrichum eremochloae]|nr:hypothetical protein LZ32DRAFT_147715 [Colletotrichum eremochloae]
MMYDLKVPGRRCSGKHSAPPPQTSPCSPHLTLSYLTSPHITSPCLTLSWSYHAAVISHFSPPIANGEQQRQARLSSHAQMRRLVHHRGLPRHHFDSFKGVRDVSALGATRSALLSICLLLG